jgi:hypothetical protein
MKVDRLLVLCHLSLDECAAWGGKQRREDAGTPTRFICPRQRVAPAEGSPPSALPLFTHRLTDDRVLAYPLHTKFANVEKTLSGKLGLKGGVA